MGGLGPVGVGDACWGGVGVLTYAHLYHDMKFRDGKAGSVSDPRAAFTVDIAANKNFVYHISHSHSLRDAVRY